LAHYAWGSAGTYNYQSLATTEVAKIKNSDLDVSALRPGDAFNSCRYPSYFMVSQHSAYGVLSPSDKATWTAVKTQCYSTLNNATVNGGKGLLPETCLDSSRGGSCSDSNTQYKYNSCRIPLRVGMDYCYYGTAAASTYLTPMATWLNQPWQHQRLL
jgi:endoglucanase